MVLLCLGGNTGGRIVNNPDKASITTNGLIVGKIAIGCPAVPETVIKRLMGSAANGLVGNVPFSFLQVQSLAFRTHHTEIQKNRMPITARIMRDAQGGRLPKAAVRMAVDAWVRGRK